MMGRVSVILSLIGLFTFVSCRGYVDADDPNNVPEGVLRIFADKTSIKADGTQTVTFTVKYGAKDVSTDKNMNLIYIAGDSEISMKPGLNVFSTTVPAGYVFKARYYSGAAVYTDNEVAVNAVAVSEGVGQKDYYQKLWGMQFTAVSCTYCPLLTASLKNVMKDDPERIVLTAFHVSLGGDTSDPMRLEVNEDIRDVVKHSDGLPLFAFNMFKSAESIVNEEDKIIAQRDLMLDSYPATCGVSVSAEYDAAEVRVTGKVTSNVAERLRYHILLVEDGIAYDQIGAEGDYVHDNVVRAVIAENKWGDNLNSGLPVEVGVEVSVTRTVKISDDWKPENMRAVFVVLSLEGDAYICNNVNECVLGSSSDYILN